MSRLMEIVELVRRYQKWLAELPSNSFGIQDREYDIVII
jgi:phage anti-repressor protein